MISIEIHRETCTFQNCHFTLLLINFTTAKLQQLLPYLLLRDFIHEERDKKAGDGADPVGHTHQNTSVSGRDIQVIHVKAGNGEAAARDADRQGDGSRGPALVRGRVSHHQKEERLHAKAAAVEDLPDIRRRHDAVFAKVIRQQTTARHDHRHQQMRQRADDSGL